MADDIPDHENPFTPIGKHLGTMRDALESAQQHLDNVQRGLDGQKKKKAPASSSPAVRDLGMTE